MSVNKFRRQFLPHVPPVWAPAFKLVFFHTLDLSPEEKALGEKIESFRAQIPAEHGGEVIVSYGSPHSSTFEYQQDSEHAKPGDLNNSSVSATMQTGSNIHKGILLKRIVENVGCKRVLELGTNTGFSGAYFISGGNTHLVTIEGSEDLCKIADKNMRRVGEGFTVINALFDEAIDELIAKGERFDAVFIDGQHEREATLHYARRVAPLMEENGLFIFDDVYWSDDMNNAWKDLQRDFDFAEGVDLFLVGLLRGKSNGEGLTMHDLGKVLPRPPFSRGKW